MLLKPYSLPANGPRRLIASDGTDATSGLTAGFTRARSEAEVSRLHARVSPLIEKGKLAPNIPFVTWGATPAALFNCVTYGLRDSLLSACRCAAFRQQCDQHPRINKFISQDFQSVR